MNKYGIDEATEAKLYDEAEEYSKTDEFELDKQDMQYKLQMEARRFLMMKNSMKWSRNSMLI